MSRFAWHQFLIWFHLFLKTFQPQFGIAQCIPTGISETVTASAIVLNSYYPGEANADAGQNSISVGARRGNFDIVEGDLLLIIQMQGVEINPTLPDNIVNGDYADGPGLLDRQGHLNTANNRAGQYEYAVANGPVSAGSLTLKANLLNSYRHSLTPSGNLGAQTFQVVRVANYLNLTIDDGASVSALPWNGRTGGIVAIDVAGNFAIGGLIDVSSQGFRGGGRRASEVVNNLPGHRGEGIAGTPRLVYDGLVITDLGTFTYPGTASGNFAPDRGVGAAANAGGSSVLDGGGGGGSNGANGGNGSLDDAINPGNNSKGAIAMNILGGNRLFMGGGGGSGGRDDDSGDNDDASSGQPGGGIILIRATALTIPGTGVRTLRANGRNGGSQASEGAGGGGGGGTILIYTESDNLFGLNVEARGGNGGSTTLSQDGGGGGGGGGFALLTRIGGGSFSGLPNIDVSGGAPGNSGPNTTAATGGTGGFSTGSLPGNAFTCDLSILPVTLTFFEAYAQADQTVRLVWETILEVDNAYYVLARAGQDLHFETISQIEGAGQSQVPLLYQWIDTEPLSGINYYRLQAIDINGEVSDTFIASVIMETDRPYHLYPNPTANWLYLKWQWGTSPVSVSIHNVSGQEWILSSRQPLEANKTYAWELKSLPPGLYILKIKTEQRSYVEKIILQP